MSGTELGDDTFRTAFDYAVDGVLIGESDGTIISANPAACRIFGATEEQLCAIGRPGISNPDDPAWHRVLVERKSAGWAIGVVPMFRLDGTPLLAEISSAAFAGPSGEGRACLIVRDVTARVRMERRLVACDKITEALLANVKTGEVLKMIARHACVIFDAMYASVITRRDHGGVEVVADYGPNAEEERLQGPIFPPGGLPEKVMVSGEPLLVDDLTATTRSREVRDLGIGPGMLTPIGLGEAVVGALLVGARPSRHPYREEDLAEAARYAYRAGVAVAVGSERAEIEGRLRRTSEQLKQALDSRLVIEQAKGFLACVRRIDPEEAFELLRRYARSHNADIHAVARQILDRRLVV